MIVVWWRHGSVNDRGKSQKGLSILCREYVQK